MVVMIRFCACRSLWHTTPAACGRSARDRRVRRGLRSQARIARAAGPPRQRRIVDLDPSQRRHPPAGIGTASACTRRKNPAILSRFVRRRRLVRNPRPTLGPAHQQNLQRRDRRTPAAAQVRRRRRARGPAFPTPDRALRSRTLLQRNFQGIGGAVPRNAIGLADQSGAERLEIDVSGTGYHDAAQAFDFKQPHGPATADCGATRACRSRSSIRYTRTAAW